MTVRKTSSTAMITLAACLVAGCTTAQKAPEPAATTAPPPAPPMAAANVAKPEGPPGSRLPNPPITDDGVISVPPFKLPYSSYASSQAAAEYARLMHAPPPNVAANPADALKAAEESYKPAMAKVQAMYPYTSTHAPIAGVDAETFVPKAGVSPENKGRVLISLGGGGTAPTSALGAAPIAGAGRITVISVNPRIDKFPHASEDLEAVYRALLKTHKPENIGIYGCSGGGQMTGQVVAWFYKQKLPMPGAIGIYCAGLYPFGQGDSEQIWPRLGMNGRSVVPRVGIKDWNITIPANARYNGGESYMNPLIRPSADKELLKHFPPTLLLTGTRSDDMSAAVQTNLDLLDAGVKTQLVLFDGMWHGFFSDPDLPESQQAYRIMVKWFSENLGKHHKG